MTKNSMLYFMILVILGMIVMLLSVKPSNSLCKKHEDLFHSEIKSGMVIEKFIDTLNHATETVVFVDGNKKYILLLIPDSNNKDFEKIRVRDKITKVPNSFQFTLNDSYKFTFDIQCDF
ncbi:hypothetical protein [Pseudochryseolinea flava]|uniref:Uncharacterized protein n=1 Tax=Pseudochryseolinea flava TaxID=2059302 RepID=A0A364XXD9_9BACT|nr:hypothetical protein [Pseudochryseolinea flava]RAV98884.1 hypothetical protein DQQ10_21520 [Pseudochryseolinea flava]